jgi:hypothetical protein
MKETARHGEGTAPIRAIDHAPMPAIRMIGAAPTTDRSARVRWTMVLVWFMRTMAVAWIAKGLLGWTIVLGINSGVAEFIELPALAQGMIGFFAVADLMAAVGLWLAAPWGGVLWLICAATEVMAATLGAGASMAGAFGVILDLGLIAAYFALSWLAANERV